MDSDKLKGRFTFTLSDEAEDGKNTESRVYGATMLSPFDGYRFGSRVAKILGSSIPSELSGLKEGDMGKLVSTVIKSLGSIEEGAIEQLVIDLMAKTQIHANLNGDKTTKKSINSRNEFTQWFNDCRQDIFPFAFHLIFRNSTPFLPKRLQSKIENLINEYKG